jgi:CopG antitoxin of type II toxin-antitoxin system
MDVVKERESIPDFTTLDDIAQFWDMHSTADYADLTHEVQFEINLRTLAENDKSITLLPHLSKVLTELARVQGVSVETLVNVWLTEKALELA